MNIYVEVTIVKLVNLLQNCKCKKILSMLYKFASMYINTNIREGREAKEDAEAQQNVGFSISLKDKDEVYRLPSCMSYISAI